jgi:hypothetical protein
MSLTPSLSSALSTLSLASQPDFTSPFTLISADGHRFTVDALKLAGSSTVFRDMLESGGGQRQCALTERREDVELFINAIEKGDPPKSDEGWYALAKMSHKYDSLLAKSVAEVGAWCVFSCLVLRRSSLTLPPHRRSTQPLFLYSAGCLLGDESMTAIGAERSLQARREDYGGLFSLLTYEDRRRQVSNISLRPSSLAILTSSVHRNNTYKDATKSCSKWSLSSKLPVLSLFSVELEPAVSATRAVPARVVFVILAPPTRTSRSTGQPGKVGLSMSQKPLRIRFRR